MKPKKSRSGKPYEVASAAPSRSTEKLVSLPEPIPRAGEPAPFPVPAILLEGDESASAGAPGLGQKFIAGAPALSRAEQPEVNELPEAYGTGRLFLVPRDPQCFYAHWDLTLEQQERYNGLSKHRHLVLRVYLLQPAGELATELHVHPESRHWFVHLGKAGISCYAELGYYQPNGEWRRVAVSGPTSTPRSGVGEVAPAQFTTVSLEPAPAPPAVTPHPQVAPTVPLQTTENAQAQAVANLQDENKPGPSISAPTLPAVSPSLGWTLLREEALQEILQIAAGNREWIGSLAIEELIRRAKAGVPEEISLAGELGAPAGFGEVQIAPPIEISSPTGGEFTTPQGFWISLNAELVVYGATEPDAQVTIGGRRISLRPDGSFSYRFALPDGLYQLHVAAASARGDVRLARLEFYRGSRYRGEVGAHPQDPALRSPAPENLG